MVAWKRQLIVFGGFHESTRLVPGAGRVFFPGAVRSGLSMGRVVLNTCGKWCLSPKTRASFVGLQLK